MILPDDDYILLSLINTALRDKYDSLEVLCEEEGINMAEITARIAALGYKYNGKSFVYSE